MTSKIPKQASKTNSINITLDDRDLSDEDYNFVWDESLFIDESDLTELELEQIALCALDVRYFIQNFCWIERKETGETLQFIPYDYQWEILEALQNGESIVGNKSRRVGASWIVSAFTAWRVNFYENINVLFLSKTENDAKKLLRKVKFILKNLAFHDHESIREATPAHFLRGQIETDNQQLMTIAWHDDEGNVSSLSEVASLTMTTSAGRSEGATLIFWDEAAFAKPDDEATWSAVFPTTTRGGQVIVFSTPNGVGGVFWKLVRQGERGENDWFKFMRIHWSQAGITQEQIDRVRSALSLSEEKYRQEFELEFTQGGHPVFDRVYLDACYKPIDQHPDIEAELVRYDEEVGVYYSGVDSSTGSRKSGDADYNAWVSWTNHGLIAHTERNRKLLGDWAGKPIRQADGSVTHQKGMVSELHTMWPGPLNIEKNNTGYTVVNSYDHPQDGISSMTPVGTDSKSKERIIQQFIVAVEGQQVVITDPNLYFEMYDYQRGNRPGQYEAPPGGNDDLIMAAAWGYDSLLRHGAREMPEAIKVSKPTRSSFTGRMDGIGLPQTGMSIRPYAPGNTNDPYQGVRQSYQFDQRRTLPVPGVNTVPPPNAAPNWMRPNPNEGDDNRWPNSRSS